MPNFKFRAIDHTGKNRRGSIFAFDEADVEVRLKGSGLTLVFVKRLRETRSFRLPGASVVNRRILIEFYHRLSQTLDLGLPVLSALDENAKILPSKALREIINEVRVAIEGGNTLYEAMERFPDVFHKFDLSLVKLGEKSGVLPKSIKDLAEFLEWKEEISSLMKRAAIYPAFIFTAILGVIAVWIGYVLPQMATVLTEMGIELPTITRIVLTTSLFVQENWVLMFLTALAIPVILWLIQKDPRGGILIHRLILRIPLIGRITTNIALTRFCRNFATMYDSGMSMSGIFGILTDNVLGNKFLESRLSEAYEEIQQGRNLADGLEEVGGFPPLLIGAIRNGETTGTLDSAFIRLSDYYDEEVKKTVGALLAALEPITIILLGAIFGIIILSILLPLYGVISELGEAY